MSGGAGEARDELVDLVGRLRKGRALDSAIVDALLRDKPTVVLAALGGVYNGKSTEPLHWWRLPIEGSFDA